jgi:hypothetical protein
VIEWLDYDARGRLERHKERLEGYRKVIAEAKKILPKLEAECKQLEEQADEKMKEYAKGNYGIDSKKVSDHAKKSVEQLAHDLRTADFELVGLEARIDLIGKFKAGGNITDQGTLIKLDQMLITDEIQRAGVLARRNAYEEAFELAKELYDVIVSRDAASGQKLAREKKLKSAHDRLPSAEELVADPPPHACPVEVYENKVTIYPVRTN